MNILIKCFGLLYYHDDGLAWYIDFQEPCGGALIGVEMGVLCFAYVLLRFMNLTTRGSTRISEGRMGWAKEVPSKERPRERAT